ncbi:phosphatase PAP2 family protein [Vicingaceae bacterium]|nr:phosphatase PAP2 family protein [Vicingaceae bacterium]MDB4082955.1 phosphatase PAP2 family protein [Vicingaceae bacterium]MDB9963553.1 phosphatase PAP2 family protein [Vicingaceae bacterium]MDC0004878.1 phosphatase PAP2 family protein [bacterium]MDC1451375.1 phosphatase PAP2 family protein [Vicingaceae bacterium]
MVENLEQWDRELFVFLNGFHSESLDFVMWHVSGKLQWIPLYLFLLFLLTKKYGKLIWVILVATALTVTLADQFSVKLFKEVFERWRPCHNLDLKEMVHLVNDKCGGRFGFVSSHAANSFATAGLLGLFFNRKSLYLLLIWASLVSYSRVYLGVHYPSDILGGAIIGLIVAFLVHRIASSILNYLKDA